MKKYFWSKNNQILADNTSLIKSRTYPCGDYCALLVFVARPINHPNETADITVQPGIAVQPHIINQGKIFFNGRAGISWSGCIQINKTPDSQGKVGYVNDCSSIYDQCTQYDENDNCIQTETNYSNCYQINVYRIGTCYDLSQQGQIDFTSFICSKCSKEEYFPEVSYELENQNNENQNNENQNILPKLWAYSYNTGQVSATYQILNCIYKDRDLSKDSWYKYAYLKYVLKALFQFDIYEYSIVIYANTLDGYQISRTNQICDGECLSTSPDVGCTSCNGTMYTEQWTDFQQTGFANVIYSPAWGNNHEVWRYSWPIYEDQKAYNDAIGNSVGPLNNQIGKLSSDLSKYAPSRTETIGTTFRGNYSSYFMPNQCWATSGVGIHRKFFNFAKLTIDKWHEDLKYKGVKVNINVVQKKGDSDANQHSLSLQKSTQILVDNEIKNIYFGTTLEFPLNDNMAPFSPHEQEGYVSIYPLYSNCEYCSTVEISIDVLDFIREKETEETDEK